MNDIAPASNLPAGKSQGALLLEINVDLLTRRAELIAAVHNAPAKVTADNVGDFADLGKQCQVLIGDAETRRTAAKRPWLTGGTTVDNFFNLGIRDKIKPLITSLTDRGKVFQDQVEAEEKKARAAALAEAEKERRAAEQALVDNAPLEGTVEGAEAEIEAEERLQVAQAESVKAAKAVLAKPADMARQRGSMGGIMSYTKEWDCRWQREKLDPAAILAMIVDSELDKIVRRHMRNTSNRTKRPDKLQGVVFFQKGKSDFR